MKHTSLSQKIPKPTSGDGWRTGRPLLGGEYLKKGKSLRINQYNNSVSHNMFVFFHHGFFYLNKLESPHHTIMPLMQQQVQARDCDGPQSLDENAVTMMAKSSRGFFIDLMALNKAQDVHQWLM